MKLEHQRNSQEAELREARLRLQEGAPPSDDCEHEWYRMERDRVRRQEMMMERTRLADTQGLFFEIFVHVIFNTFVKHFFIFCD